MGQASESCLCYEYRSLTKCSDRSPSLVPIYPHNNNSHDGGNPDYMIWVPPVATNVSGQMESSLRDIYEEAMEEMQAIMTPAPNSQPPAPPSPASPSPAPPPPPPPTPPPVFTIARDIYQTSGRCNYVSPQGDRCPNKMMTKRDSARHWLAVHMRSELEGIEAGEMTMAQASIITTHAQQRAANRYKVYCPLSEGCNIPNRFFIRKDRLMRHIAVCARDQGLVFDGGAWASANMVLQTDMPTVAPEWENKWEAAIWRIFHA